MIAVLALGDVGCACAAAMAETPDTHHAGHGLHDGHSDVVTRNCCEQRCDNNCHSLRADDVAQVDSLVNSRQTDDEPGEISVDLTASVLPTASVRRSSSGTLRLLLATDTPVRRFDRLLD